MKVNVERVLVMLVVFSFASTSINIFATRGCLVTREEAIEISRKSKLVQSVVEAYQADNLMVIEVRYRPESNKNHGIWYIEWSCWQTNTPGSALISQFIDEVTGEILEEGAAGLP